MSGRSSGELALGRAMLLVIMLLLSVLACAESGDQRGWAQSPTHPPEVSQSPVRPVETTPTPAVPSPVVRTPDQDTKTTPPPEAPPDTEAADHGQPSATSPSQADQEDEGICYSPAHVEPTQAPTTASKEDAAASALAMPSVREKRQSTKLSPGWSKAIFDNRPGMFGEFSLERLQPGVSQIPPREPPEKHFIKWSPDGSKVLFGYIDPRFNKVVAPWIHSVTVDSLELEGLAAPSELFASWPPAIYFDISFDGSQLLYTMLEYLESPPDATEFSYPPRRRFMAKRHLDSGDTVRLTFSGSINHLEWSPDGSQIAFLSRSSCGKYCIRSEIHTMTSDGASRRNITIPLYQSPYDIYVYPPPVPTYVFPIRDYPPKWSPDGQSIAFAAHAGDPYIYDLVYYIEDRNIFSRGSGVGVDMEEFIEFQGIYVAEVGDMTCLRKLQENAFAPSWSPDGSRIAFAGASDEDTLSLFTIASDGTDLHMIRPITDLETFHDDSGRYRDWLSTLSWSPGGSHIMYSCDWGICVVSVDGDLVTTLPPQDGRSYYYPSGRAVAAWSPDGTRIAVRTQLDWDVRVYVVDIDSGDERPLVWSFEDNEGVYRLTTMSPTEMKAYLAEHPET